MLRITCLMLALAAALRAQCGPEDKPEKVPSIVTKVQPTYTQEAHNAGISGIVILRTIIGTNGIPHDFKVLNPVGYGLDEAAILAVRKWRFKPAEKCGVASEQSADIEIHFKISSVGAVNDKQEILRSSYNVGVQNLTGELVPQDFKRARQRFQSAADGGLPQAQFALAKMLLEGQGGDKDESKAMEWSRKAADQKLSEAELLLGQMYAAGQGAPKDNAKAVEWFRKAADRKFPAAEAQLGLAYQAGEGVTADPKQAAQWFRRSAEHGSPGGRYLLAICYRDGLGVTKDPAEAFAWMQLAAFDNLAPAQTESKKMSETISREDLTRADVIIKKWARPPQ